jgi:hypothetical protein
MRIRRLIALIAGLFAFSLVKEVFRYLFFLPPNPMPDSFKFFALAVSGVIAWLVYRLVLLKRRSH